MKKKQNKKIYLDCAATTRQKPPQVLKAGDWNYVPRGTIHRQQNLSGKPARYIEMRIFDKGKPAAEQVP